MTKSNKAADTTIDGTPANNDAPANNVASDSNATSAVKGKYEAIDQAYKANLAQFSMGISPAGLATSYFDWLAHLIQSPGKQMELVEAKTNKDAKLLRYAIQCAMGSKPDCCIEPLSNDRRFNHDGWKQWPYNVIYQSFLLNQQWWHKATNDIDGLAPDNEHVVSFIARQILDRYSPSNYPLLNPEISQETLVTGGMNLIKGGQNFVEDMERIVTKKPPLGSDEFQAGENLATTAGKVVYRNHLIELIQYEPTTKKVYAEPILIVPAWIMKYYILDLSVTNSLVKYLVDQGYTVFMISWRNPDSEDRELRMEDYRRMGPMAALDAVTSIVPEQNIHAVGYCLGGTLLSIAAAAMARDHDKRLASLTTLATQVDFSEAGELMLFIDESEVDYLESMMQEKGYLEGKQMAGAFQILRSNDLIWSRMVHNYMLGKRRPMNDLMAWNADLTRMPYRMHSEYLRKLFLNNDLASGHYQVNGRPVVMDDIRTPMFIVATNKDHVAPWKSVYKIHLLADTDEITFVLTSGGHNAGIVSEPGHPRRTFQIATHQGADLYIDPDTWRENTDTKEGSWWPAWQTWLSERSSAKIKPPTMGNEEYPPIMDAPGSYVMMA